MKEKLFTLNYVLLIMSTSFMFGCNERDGAFKNSTELTFRFGVDSLRNMKIISFIKEYIEDNQDGVPKVYTLVTQRKDISTSYISLCCMTTYSEMFESIPSGYFKIDDNVVLVYTGLEYFNKPDSKFIRELEMVVGNRIEDDLLSDRKTRNAEHETRIYDPKAWEIIIKMDSIIVNRDSATNVLGPPMTRMIKFVPKRNKKK